MKEITPTTPRVLAPVMSKPEADFFKVKIHEEMEAGTQHYESAFDLILQYRDREGWKHHGYKSFQEFYNTELANRYGSRARVYRMLNYAEVRKELADVPAASVITAKHATILARIPTEHRKEVWEDAVRECGTPNSNQLEHRVNRWLERQERIAAKPKNAAERLKRDQAYKVIKKACGHRGRNFIRAIEAGLIKSTFNEVVTLGAQPPEVIRQAEALVALYRWPIRRCLNFLNDMPTEKHALEKLITLAKANQGTWTGTIAGAEITVKLQ